MPCCCIINYSAVEDGFPTTTAFLPLAFSMIAYTHPPAGIFLLPMFTNLSGLAATKIAP